MRSRYWSHSKMVRWVQTTFTPIQPLESGTREEWDEYHKKLKKYPFINWFVEEFVDKVQNFFNYPTDKLNDIRYYCRNRFITKTHLIDAKLSKGKWHETEERMLHGMFELLVQFIEVEQAGHNMWCSSSDYTWWEKFQFRWLFKSVPPTEGIKYLHWEMDLKYDDHWISKDDPIYGLPTHQALSAKTQYELYNWWKNVRPYRADPMEASGWTAYCDSRREDGSIFGTRNDSIDTGPMLDKMRALEEQYESEDTAMLIKLIEIRRGMWT